MYRVLIRAHTCRRDVAPAALLAGILEKMGCEVVVASIRMFTNSLKQWRPDAVVIFNPGSAPSIRSILPKTKIIFTEGECFCRYSAKRSDYCRDNQNIYDSIDLIQTCGEAQQQPFFEWAGSSVKEKVKVVGNLKLDLARFLPSELIETSRSNSVGVVGRFPKLNHYEGEPAFFNLVGEENLDYLINSSKAFFGTFKSIKEILQSTDLNVSIRPHPLEALEYYDAVLAKHFTKQEISRVDVDSTLDFSSWAAKQKVLISPTSTSFLEATLLGVPVINLDKICDTSVYNKEYTEAAAEWQQGGIMANDLEHLSSVLNKELPRAVLTPEIKKQLEEQSDFKCEESSALRAAKQIIELLSQNKNPILWRWPKWMALLRDEVSFRRAMKKSPLHANFNYKNGYHKIPKHFDSMIKSIMDLE